MRKATGSHGLVDRTINTFATNLADASQATDTTAQLLTNLKGSLSKSFESLKTDLSNIKEKSTVDNIRSELGINSPKDVVNNLTKSGTVKTAFRGVVRATEKSVAARKERIQNERLPLILARAEELLSKSGKTAKVDPKRLATSYKNANNAIQEDTENLLLTIGGNTQTANNGVFIAEDINKAFKELGILGKRVAVGMKNPDTFIGASGNPIMPALGVARPNVRGFSRDAEEVTAQAVAALVKNPNLKVTIIGESGGGLRAEEIAQNLNKLGFKDRVTSIGAGTPSFKGKASRPENHTAYLSRNKGEWVGEQAENLLEPLGLLDTDYTRQNPKVSQSIKGVSNHTFEDYLELAPIQQLVFGDDIAQQLGGLKQTRATDKSLKALKADLIGRLKMGYVADAQKQFDKFEAVTRITGKQQAGFNTLKGQVAGVQKERKEVGAIANTYDYVSTFGKALPKAVSQGDVDYVSGIQKKLPQLEIELRSIAAQKSKLTQQVAKSVLEDLQKLKEAIPTAQAQALLQQKSLNAASSNKLFGAEITKTSSEPSTKESFKQAIVAYKNKVIAFRKELDKKLLAGTATDQDLAVGAALASRGTALAASLKGQKGFSKEATALSGVSATLAKKAPKKAATKVGEEVVNGILVGANQNLADVLAQGEELGVHILTGFKSALEIKSPSRKFIKAIKDIGGGIALGAKGQLSTITSSGKLMGRAIAKGFKGETKRSLSQILIDANHLAHNSSKFAAKELNLQADNKRRISLTRQSIRDNQGLRKQIARKLPTATNPKDRASFLELDRKVQAKLIASKKQLNVLNQQSQVYRKNAATIKTIVSLNKALKKAIATQDVNKIKDISEKIANINAELNKTQQQKSIFQDLGVDDLETGINDISSALSNLFSQNSNGKLLQSIKILAPQLGRELANGLGRFLSEVGKTTALKDLPKNILSGIFAATKIKRPQQIFSTERGRNALAVGTVLGGILLARQLKITIGNAIVLQKEIDTVNKKLAAINSAPATNIFEEFTEEANRARQRVIDFASSYAGMVTSLKRKVASPRKLFSELTAGLGDRGVIGESAGRATTALQQMAAKGVVSMEELRQQLSEALPGAFAIAAKAMGISEKRLIALVSSGQLVSSDFLPKLAKELQVTGSGATTFTEELVKMQNTADKMRFEALSILPLKEGAIATHGALKLVQSVIKPLTLVGLPLLTALIGNLVIQLGSMAVKTKLVGTALGFVGSVATPLLLITAALGSAMSLYDSLTVSSANNIRKLNKELQNLGATQEEIQSTYKATGALSFLPLLGEQIVRFKRDKNLPGLDRETVSERQERVVREEVVKELPLLLDIDLEYRTKTKDSAIQDAANTVASDLERIQDLAYRVARREIFDISPTQATQIQKEIEALQRGIDASLEQTFNISMMEKALKNIDSRRKYIESEIGKGASEEKYQVTIDELDVREENIRKSLDKVKRLLIDNRPLMQLDIDSNALQQSLSNLVAQVNTQLETASIKSAIAEGLLPKAVDVRGRKTQIEARNQELAHLEKINQKTREYLALLSKVQQERLLDISGASSLENIGFTEIERAKKTLETEEAAGVTPDKILSNAVTKLGELATNSQRAADIQKEQARASLDLINGIRDLNIQFDNLSVSKLQRSLDVKDLNLQLKRTFKNNASLFTNRLRLSRETRQNARSVKQQERAFEDMVRNIRSNSRQISDVIKDLAIRIDKAGQELVSLALKGIGSYMSAAKIDDLFGLSQLRNLATKGIDITKSDRRPQLEKQVSTEQRQYDRRTSDSLRQQARMNSDIDNAVADLQDQLSELTMQRARTLDDTDISMDRLLVRILEIQNTTNQVNREILGANQAAKESGMNRQEAPLDVTLPSLEDFKEAPNAVLQQLDTIFGQLAKAKQTTIDFYKQIQIEGNTQVAQALESDRLLFQEKLQGIREEITVEGQRISQANQNLIKEISGTAISINDNLIKRITETSKRALEAQESVQGLLKQAGIGFSRNQMLQSVQEKALLDVEGKISEFELAQSSLERLLKVYQGEGGQGFLSEMLNSEQMSKALDPTIRQQLLQEVEAATTSKDFKGLEGKIKSLITTYKELNSNLKNSKEDIVSGVTELAVRPGIRKIEDSRLLLQEEKLAGNRFSTDKEKALARIDLDEQKAQLDLQRQLQDMVGQFPIEVIDQYRKNMEALNNIKFDRLRKEASELNKILGSMQDSLGSELTNFISGIGEALLTRGDREKEILQQKADYGEKLQQLNEQYQNDPELLEEKIAKLGDRNKEIISNIKSEFSGFNAILNLGKQALADFAKSLAQVAAKMAAQKIVSSLFSGVFGGGVGNFNNGGTVGIENFNNGGNVLGLATGISQAMIREGNGAVPIVAKKGEQVLSTNNKDAQFYRALKRSGDWDELKNGGVHNFNFGGIVGTSSSEMSYQRSHSKPSRGGNYKVITNYNITTKDANSFRKSQSQLLAEAQARQRREFERNS
ncbi:MAG: tape measure protein [Xenococcus sp. (in: cyanobacteria)]